MGVVRVDSVEELLQQVGATQEQLAGLYLDEKVSVRVEGFHGSGAR
jgi:hypothetical protein